MGPHSLNMDQTGKDCTIVARTVLQICSLQMLMLSKPVFHFMSSPPLVTYQVRSRVVSKYCLVGSSCSKKCSGVSMC